MERVGAVVGAGPLIEPYYPKARQVAVRGSEWSACCGFIFSSNGFNLSDPVVEKTVYDSQAMRRFVGIEGG